MVCLYQIFSLMFSGRHLSIITLFRLSVSTFSSWCCASRPSEINKLSMKSSKYNVNQAYLQLLTHTSFQTKDSLSEIKRKEIQTRWNHTANERPVKILYKCLVPIYVFPEMKLLLPKQNYCVLSPSSYTHIFVRDLYIYRIGLPILLQGNICGPILGIYT